MYAPSSESKPWGVMAGVASFLCVAAAGVALTTPSPTSALMVQSAVKPVVPTYAARLAAHPYNIQERAMAQRATPAQLMNVAGTAPSAQMPEFVAARVAPSQTSMQMGLFAGLMLATMGLASRLMGSSKPTYAMFSASGEKEAVEDDEEDPVWVRREKAAAAKPDDLPFGVYLLFSVITCIAAVGSMFEYLYKNPIFGVVQPDSPFWAPTLIWLIVSGLPVSGYLLYKAISVANEMAENLDDMDGY